LINFPAGCSQCFTIISWSIMYLYFLLPLVNLYIWAISSTFMSVSVKPLIKRRASFETVQYALASLILISLDSGYLHFESSLVVTFIETVAQYRRRANIPSVYIIFRWVLSILSILIMWGTVFSICRSWGIFDPWNWATAKHYSKIFQTVYLHEELLVQIYFQLLFLRFSLFRSIDLTSAH